MVLADAGDFKIHGPGGALQQQLEPLGAEFLDELVRVLGAGDGEDPHLDAGILEHGHGPLGGGLARPVGIVAEHHGIGIAADELGLLLGQGGAQGGHGVIEAPLVEAHHVHIALAEDQLLPLGVLGEVEGEKVAALFKHRGIPAVEVFGALVPQVPPAEGHHAPPQVDDGEDDPVAEGVVAAAVLPPDRQGGGDRLLVGKALAPQVAQEEIPALRGVPQAEPGDGLLGQAPADEVGPALPPGVGHEGGVEEPRRLPVQLQQPGAELPPGVLQGALRHRHPGLAGQLPHRVQVIQVLDLPQEGDGVPPCPAAEAVEGLGIGVDGEGRGLFRMEGAEAGEVLAPAAELDIPPDDLLNVGIVFQLVEKRFRDHGPSLLSSGSRPAPFSRGYLPQGFGMKISSKVAMQKRSLMPAM